MLYTAQYRYSGQDRLDITVKGNDPAGRVFAPTWDMVSRYKKRMLTDGEYADMYYALLVERYQTHGEEVLRLVEMVKDSDITLVCFCPSGSFCHRHLLVKFLQYNWATEYGGERVL